MEWALRVPCMLDPAFEHAITLLLPYGGENQELTSETTHIIAALLPAAKQVSLVGTLGGPVLYRGSDLCHPLVLWHDVQTQDEHQGVCLPCIPSPCLTSLLFTSVSVPPTCLNISTPCAH